MAISLGELLAKLGLDASDFLTGLNNAEKALGTASKRMKSIGKTMSTHLTLPLVAASTASIKLASDFQETMTTIETLVGIAGDRVNKMKGEVISLSDETGRSSNELAKALFAVTSAGQRGAEAMDILRRSAKASAVGLGDTKEIAKSVTAIMNAYGKENISATKATDQLLAVVREGNLDAAELAPTLGRVIGIASQLGISFDEVGASIATFTRLGVDSAEAVTGLRGIMSTLISPTEQGSEALAKIGMTFSDLRYEVKQKGLAQTLLDLMEKFKGNSEGLSALIPNVRALSAVLGTAGSQGKTYAAIQKSIASASGLVDEGFKRVAEDSGFQFKRTLEQLKNTGIELGNMLLPIFNKLLQAVRDGINWFRSLSTETKSLILVVGGLAAALGPVLTLIGTIGTIIAAINAPIAIAIAAIVALGAAFVYIWDNWEAIKERITDWTWWQNLLIDMAQFILKYNPIELMFKPFDYILSKLGIEIPKPFEEIANKLEEMRVETNKYEHEFGSFGDAVAHAADKAKSALAGLWNSIGGGGGGSAASNPLELVKAQLYGLRDGIDAFYARHKKMNPLDFTAFKNSFKEGAESIKKFANTAHAELIKVDNGVRVTGDTIQSLVGGALSDFGNALGELIVNNDMGSFFEGLLRIVMNFVKQFGEMLIASGIAAMAFEDLLIAPGAAIAAGVALVALASAVSALLSKGPGGSGSAQGMADGGIVPPGYPNDTYPAMLTSGETVTPPKKLPSMSNSEDGYIAETRISGSDLLILIKRAERKFDK